MPAPKRHRKRYRELRPGDVLLLEGGQQRRVVAAVERGGCLNVTVSGAPTDTGLQVWGADPDRYIAVADPAAAPAAAAPWDAAAAGGVVFLCGRPLRNSTRSTRSSNST